MNRVEYSPEDNELERRAKEHPEALFHLHVGPSALSKVKAKSEVMGLNDLERKAALGNFLAIAFDEYADMHHIGRLVGVPSRQKLRENMDKGEAFWRGFQISQGEVVLKNGFRSKILNEERFPSWLYAKSINYKCAMEGFTFGALNGPQDKMPPINQFLGEDIHASFTPSSYLNSIDSLVAAIETLDRNYFQSK